MSELRQQVADLSLSISEKVIGEALDQQRQRELIATFLEQTEELK
jgi:F0F1-type ATP synthase membrane subunit b/b'